MWTLKKYDEKILKSFSTGFVSHDEHDGITAHRSQLFHLQSPITRLLITEKDITGYTPVHYAARTGNLEVTTHACKTPNLNIWLLIGFHQIFTNKFNRVDFTFESLNRCSQHFNPESFGKDRGLVTQQNLLDNNICQDTKKDNKGLSPLTLNFFSDRFPVYRQKQSGSNCEVRLHADSPSRLRQVRKD